MIMNIDAIQTFNLTRDFKTIRAVNNLTLAVPAGSVFGFLGPNGAGKTTTIRLLLGLLEPTQGHALVLGNDIRTQSDRIREKSGALLEHNGLYERLSAEDNLQFYARVWHLSRPERQTRINTLLDHLGLFERRKEIVGTWSRGMKQKLAIARTLLHRPKLVFFDEPTAGLDPLAAASLHVDIANLAEREGVTIFLTTHNLSEAEKLCHQVGILKEGQLVALGPLDELRTSATMPQVEVRGHRFTPQLLNQLRRHPLVDHLEQRNQHLTIYLETNSEIAPLVRQMVNAGVDIEEIHKTKASLEKTFLNLMENEQQEITGLQEIGKSDSPGLT